MINKTQKSKVFAFMVIPKKVRQELLKLNRTNLLGKKNINKKGDFNYNLLQNILRHHTNLTLEGVCTLLKPLPPLQCCFFRLSVDPNIDLGGGVKKTWICLMYFAKDCRKKNLKYLNQNRLSKKPRFMSGNKLHTTAVSERGLNTTY